MICDTCKYNYQPVCDKGHIPQSVNFDGKCGDYVKTEKKAELKQQIINKAEEIAKALKQGNDVEVRKNPKGELAILKVKKQNI